MNARMRMPEAVAFVLGLALAVHFGCTGGGSEEGLSPEEQGIVDAVRASGIQVITAAELKKELASAKPPILVDALSAASFSELHYQGSISMPADSVYETAPQALPDKDARIVVYCAGFKCGASTAAAAALQKMGYTNVSDFKGGLQQSRELGVPLEGSEAGR